MNCRHPESAIGGRFIVCRACIDQKLLAMVRQCYLGSMPDYVGPPLSYYVHHAFRGVTEDDVKAAAARLQESGKIKLVDEVRGKRTPVTRIRLEKR